MAMVELHRVNNHNEVDSGDILVHVEQGSDTRSYKVSDGKWYETMARLVQIHFTDSDKVQITLVEYLSPLKQKVLKRITIN